MRETTVYASAGGRAFHGDPACRALRSGQDLNDWDTPDDSYLSSWAWPTMHAVQPTTIPDTIGSGKLPCLVCLPGYTEAWFQSSSEDDFGHEPWGPYDGAMICRRCYTVETREWVDAHGASRRQHVRGTVLWPCTSAIVLGLVARPGFCPDCRHPMDAPARFSAKCADCDHNDRIDALGTAL